MGGRAGSECCSSTKFWTAARRLRATHTPRVGLHVHRGAALIGCWESRLEGECVAGRSIMFKHPKSREPLMNRRPMADGYPPKCLVMPVEGLEEFSASRHDGRVRTSIHELEQRVGIFPDRHVDGEERVRCCADAGGIPALILQAPHETRTCVRQCVDSVQSREKVGSARVALRRGQPTHIDLCEMPWRSCSHR